jgi:hypothetical protein
MGLPTVEARGFGGLNADSNEVGDVRMAHVMASVQHEDILLGEFDLVNLEATDCNNLPAPVQDPNKSSKVVKLQFFTEKGRKDVEAPRKERDCAYQRATRV